MMNQKTNYAAPALWGNSRREGIFSTRTPNNVYQQHDSRVLRHSMRSLAETTSNRLYETTPATRGSKNNTSKRSDYRHDCRFHEEAPSQPTITTKKPAAQTQRNTVENVHDVRTLSQMSEEDTHDPTRSPIFHDNFPTFLNSIKEYVTEKDGNTYIPLHSTIVLKNRRRMLYLPLEFGDLTMDGLVDSRAFINAMSWSDYNAIKINSDNCVIKEYPQPPFKIECANAQLEQPIATADIQFNIGTYTFTDTFVVLSKTSFPIIGLNFMRNHQAVIDTANGTITFPPLK